ncbi:MAG: SDR family oxidoreductase [Thiothrix sp.]|nr:SDR family oxidoreductase [Thiothrix sp.]HPQ94084.1 SDR family oxidoreductase [Thiolinea sp.]
MRLENKRVIITAAGSGMGAAGARLFAKEGAKLALLDRDGTALETLAAEIRNKGGEVTIHQVDLTDRIATDAAVRMAISTLGGVDVLWSHAGLPAPTDVSNLDFTALDKSTALNITSAIQISGIVLPHMQKQKSGSIVFTSSAVGLVGSAFSPVYSALKAGVVGLTKGLSVRYAADNVRVNALCPGPISTPMLHNDFITGDDRFGKQENLQRAISAVPMGRVGEPAEVAMAALWLASDDASYVTGVALPVDGGQTAR